MGILIADPKLRGRSRTSSFRGAGLPRLRDPVFSVLDETLWKSYTGLVEKNVSRVYHHAHYSAQPFPESWMMDDLGVDLCRILVSDNSSRQPYLQLGANEKHGFSARTFGSRERQGNHV